MNQWLREGCACVDGSDRLPGAAELVELAAAGEDDERDLGVAEHGELVGLLEQAVAALGEGDLAVDLVLDPLQLHLAATHLPSQLVLCPSSLSLPHRPLQL